ncbi:thiol reductant ABC exporter subunit CydC [Microbacterium sp. STN6]|uniref:thiol reductant ABC exporter subunit CydC n=1 Tax=Microbacterium sp. STN6 TaxID=2995588 RepID=UPI002260B7F1|nr:thiol reductant ABC exporter subunit CydC [Microbacterium sp. STN6]MCX7521648.1 thiol reductant ABC exporter subunit CydC [Microbacterium sp. STN6]
MSALRRGPAPLAGLNALGRPALLLLSLVSTIRALALVVAASAVASGIVAVIHGTDGWHQALGWGLAAAVTRGAATWVHRVCAQRALLGAKERLRAELAEVAVERPEGRIGALSTLGTRGLDELDKYVTVFLPALIDAATVPAIVGARILFADWLSALIIVLTIPLVPAFMALIGMHTQARVAEATDALGRLSDHLVELARGLPVLVGLGRAGEQSRALRRISEDHRAKTVATLRTAFLSSLALELIATLSVAVVAVTIGVRLVAGTMPLEVGLLALLLAPECFTPLRDIGSAFHASQEGTEALGRVRAVIEKARRPRANAIGTGSARGETAAGHDGSTVRVRDLTVRYDGRRASAVEGLSFDAEPGSITLLAGASGAGKSTVLGVLTGSLADGDGVRVSGSVHRIGARGLAWLPQHPHPVADTALGELLTYGDGVPHAESLAWCLLGSLGLREVAESDPAELSPGELRRLAFARAVMRVEAGAGVVLLDEPTAHLDAASAAVLVQAIGRLRDRATVVVASHDPAVQALADRVVRVGAGAPRTVAAADETRPGERDAATSRPTRVREREAGPEHPYRELAAFLGPVAARLALASVLGALAVAFAITLTALSGWLIVRASEHPPIMYLLVAIVGVRFFGIGRGVLRYLERLVSHDAVFQALTTLRVRLWRSLAHAGSSDRRLLTGTNAIDRLVRDVDEVRDLAIRVALPPATALLVTAAVVATLGSLESATLPLFISLALVALVGAPAVAVWADRAAARGGQRLRSEVTRRFTALLAASADLRPNGVDSGVRASLAATDAEASRAARRSAWALGAADALIVLACCAASVLVLPLTVSQVAAGTLEPELVAVLALTPLGLIEPLTAHTAAVQQWPALRQVLGRVSRLTENEPPESATEAFDGPLPRIEAIELDDVAARWPGADAPVFRDVSASARRGQWLVVSGPSGSGKTTMLTMLLGHLVPEQGRYLLRVAEQSGTGGGRMADAAALDPRALRRAIAWCPQEGHLFDSTLRGNLLIARERRNAPSEAEMTDALRRVGLGRLLDSLPAGLDTPIGAAGSRLSGGERQRVAVARTLLAPADVILIDEPTAHLDDEASALLMADLRNALAERIVVLVTHHPDDVRETDERVELGREPRTHETHRGPEAEQGSLALAGNVRGAA